MLGTSWAVSSQPGRSSELHTFARKFWNTDCPVLLKQLETKLTEQVWVPKQTNGGTALFHRHVFTVPQKKCALPGTLRLGDTPNAKIII